MDATEERVLARADRLLAKHQWKTAVPMLKDLEDNSTGEDDDILLPRLAEALNGAGRFVESFDYIADNQGLFSDDLTSATTWLTAALGAGQFIDARVFIHNCPSSWHDSLMELVEEAEKKAHQTSAVSIKNQLKAFYHLGDKPVPDQSKLMAGGWKLPLVDFVTGAKFLLRDPFTNALIRSNLIETLHQLDFDEEVKYLWIDQKEYTVNPARTNDLGDDNALNQAKADLKEQLRDDPILTVHLGSQLDMEGMLLYPQVGRVISDPHEWASALVASQQGKPIHNEKIKKWQEKLNHEIQSLSEQIN